MNLFVKNIIISFLIIFSLAFSFVCFSQTQQDLRINEILIINENGITNEKGLKAPWIEIFNTAYNSVSLGGLYITDDPDKLDKFLIPKISPTTVLPQRGYLVLWADGDISQGVLHTNFNITKSTHFIALVESNGKEIIDSVTLPRNTIADVSYARETDGGEAWVVGKTPSPGFENLKSVNIPTGEVFKKHDPYGIGMSIIAMTVVFCSLIILYIVFKNIARLYSLDLKKAKLIKKGKIKEAAVIKGDTTGEVATAIAMALHLYSEQLHDEENSVLTITRVSRNYSPWSSKIYGLRQFNKKNW